MKTFYTFLFIILSFSGLKAQNHLLKTDRHGYEVSWLMTRHCDGRDCEEGWGDNLIRVGYTHAGRIGVTVGIWTGDEGIGDSFESNKLYFSTEATFSVIKQGIDHAPITVNTFANMRYGGNGYSSNRETLLDAGLALYKRIEYGENFSLNPGIYAKLISRISGGYGDSVSEFGINLQVLMKNVYLNPNISYISGTYRLGVGLGFVFPTVRR